MRGEEQEDCPRQRPWERGAKHGQYQGLSWLMGSLPGQMHLGLFPSRPASKKDF